MSEESYPQSQEKNSEDLSKKEKFEDLSNFFSEVEAVFKASCQKRYKDQ